ANMIGTSATIPASSALSSTGISTISPLTRAGADAATSSETLAPSDVPPITACSAPRWSSRATTWSPNALIEYTSGSAGRSDRPWPSRSRVTTCSPSPASARASGCCIRRGISWQWSRTTQWGPAPYSVNCNRSWPEPLSKKNWPTRSDTNMGGNLVAPSPRPWDACAVRLDAIETYYDTVPRAAATTEEVGPFTLFLAEEGVGWQFYARPRLGGDATFTADDVRRVLDRQVELGRPRAIEWVDQITPSLLPAVSAAGRAAGCYPLLALPPDTEGGAPARPRTLAAEDAGHA